MQSLLKIIFAILVIENTIYAQQNVVEDSGTKFENCHMTNLQKKFDNLPGRGWDNLQNKEMGRVLHLNFTKCKFSQDNLYLLPNDISLEPIKISKVDLYAEIFSHYSEYSTTTDSTINVEAHGGYAFFKASGSYSHEKIQVKKDQIKTKSIIARVQLRYKVYQSLFEPDSPLSQNFLNRIIDIASVLVEKNDTIFPKYLADLVIRDFGTHVIRSVDAGAVLTKIDALNSEYVKNMKSETDKDKISAAASVSFGSLFSAGISSSYSSSVTTAEVQTYQKSVQKAHIFTYGGTLYRANFTLDKWEDSVLNNLVPIDRSGDPIYYVITHRSLPHLDEKTVYEIYNLLKDAVERYYFMNTIKGCMDVTSSNFNPDANVDGNNCHEATANFTLGGVYQTCSGDDVCSDITQINPLTGGYSCPAGFNSVRLVNNKLYKCKQHCHGWWLWRHCDTNCAYYSTYWCSPNNPTTNGSAQHLNGAQFGGIISSYGGIANCPKGFLQLRMGVSTFVCITPDKDPFNPDVIPFGGFYSCEVGNPVAKLNVTDKVNLRLVPLSTLTYWPYDCAKGYIAHIYSLETACEINYCTKSNSVSLGVSPPLRRPPFISINYNPNTSKPIIFSTQSGDYFIKGKDGTWQLKEIQQTQYRILIGSILGSLAVALVVSGLVLLIQRNYYRKRERNANALITHQAGQSYGTINDLDTQA